MKKTIIIFSLFLFSGYIAAAQAITQRAATTVGELIRRSVSSNFKPDKGFQMDSCINTMVLAKFKMVNSHIDSVVFSVRSPQQIKSALQNAFDVFNKQDGQTERLKELEGRTFLLPLIVYYNMGCTPASYVTEVSQQKAMESLLKNPDFILHAALNDMMKFEPGRNTAAVDCIFIAPIYFSVMQ